MEHGQLPEVQRLICTPVGAARYGLLSDNSDQDIFVLSPRSDLQMHDPETNTSYFVWSLSSLQIYWGHPILLGNLTGDCTGDERLCDFLQKCRREIAYSAPGYTAALGLDYIAVGERYGHTSPIKAGLRTAMILSHMAAEAEDPFLLSEDEKAVLIRARTGDVPPEERVDIYRRTISPENINRLLKMPDHPTIKNELFQLIEEVITC